LLVRGGATGFAGDVIEADGERKRHEAQQREQDETVSALDNPTRIIRLADRLSLV
jgi:hypothetical protein